MTVPHRRGFTILELLVVVAIVLILGMAILPSLSSFWRNNRTKATIDLLRARVADARGHAIQHSRNYQLFVSEDGMQIMVSPQATDQIEPPETGAVSQSFSVTDQLPKTVTIAPLYTGTDESLIAVPGWIKLITFKPDGTCVEDAAEFLISEPGYTEQIARIRGLTGTLTVNPITEGAGTPGAAVGGMR